MNFSFTTKHIGWYVTDSWDKFTWEDAMTVFDVHTITEKTSLLFRFLFKILILIHSGINYTSLLFVVRILIVVIISMILVYPDPAFPCVYHQSCQQSNKLFNKNIRKLKQIYNNVHYPSNQSKTWFDRYPYIHYF